MFLYLKWCSDISMCEAKNVQLNVVHTDTNSRVLRSVSISFCTSHIVKMSGNITRPYCWHLYQDVDLVDNDLSPTVWNIGSNDLIKQMCSVFLSPCCNILYTNMCLTEWWTSPQPTRSRMLLAHQILTLSPVTSPAVHLSQLVSNVCRILKHSSHCASVLLNI